MICLSLYGNSAVFLQLFLNFLNNFCIDLEEKEELKNKKLPSSFEDIQKYSNKKMNTWHLKIVASILKKCSLQKIKHK